MLQHSTQLSGITAVHPVQNSDSGAATLRVLSRLWVFAAPHDGAVGFASPSGSSARTLPHAAGAASSPHGGRLRAAQAFVW